MPEAKARLEIPVIKGSTLRKKTPLVVGVITAGILVDRYVIPRRDFRKKTGYQREVATERVNRLVHDLINKRVDLPTAVLLNLRTFRPDVHLIKENGFYKLLLGEEDFTVVDGQHRIEGLARLVRGENGERWSGLEIPFVCLLGADELEEMRQFYVVNSTAKSVRTDLALDLLKQQAESDESVMDSLVERGESWKVDAQTLAEKISQGQVWQGRIRFPGEAKGDTTIASSGMVSSLKQLLDTPYFNSITTENQLKILDAYWQGVRKIISDVFNDPLGYGLQKSTGVMIMHGLLVSVIEYLRSKGKSVIEPESYAEALSEALLNLEGDTATGEIARGADFWKAGPAGAAGSFSSNAGRRVLLVKLRAFLPQIEVE